MAHFVSFIFGGITLVLLAIPIIYNKGYTEGYERARAVYDNEEEDELTKLRRTGL